MTGNRLKEGEQTWKGIVYLRKNHQKGKDESSLQHSRDSEPRENLHPSTDNFFPKSDSQSKSDKPIALQKGDRSCIPKNVQEALQVPKWKDTVLEEMRALEKNNALKIVTLPTGKRIVEWIFLLDSDHYSRSKDLRGNEDCLGQICDFLDRKPKRAWRSCGQKFNSKFFRIGAALRHWKLGQTKNVVLETTTHDEGIENSLFVACENVAISEEKTQQQGGSHPTRFPKEDESNKSKSKGQTPMVAKQDKLVVDKNKKTAAARGLSSGIREEEGSKENDKGLELVGG
ncbi:hypothetical protein ZIOFF_071197 [Zingiber officinale]|uniref:Uncharacterized protein n=1 Tax=Zingiber officinale TaxID=94328 RepID=A0A8J5C0R2_ZINOF|nr:hypothetical protein ZIOFF_071197 [Zingiber officinale]